MAFEDFKHPEIREFLKTISDLPSRYLEASCKILKVIDERGECSSVANPYSRLLLKTVSLRTHSLNVAAHIRTLERPGSLIYGCAVVAALGHDIAKIPGFVSYKRYLKILHAREGGKILSSLLKGIFSDEEFKTIIEAVEHHHDGEMDFTALRLLKEADAFARNSEMMKIGRNGGKGEFITPQLNPTILGEKNEKRDIRRIDQPDPTNVSLSFFDPVAFLTLLKPKINSFDMYKRYPMAFSMPNDVCYFTPEVIFETLIKAAIQEDQKTELKERRFEVGVKHIFDSGRIQDAVALVGLNLREIGALADYLLPEARFYTAQFVVRYYRNNCTDYERYMPIKAKFFYGSTTNIVSLELRKKGRPFEKIKSVEPDFGKWGKKND